MNHIYLLLGSNQGNRAKMLELALALLEQYLGKCSAHSPIYETQAWGKTDQANFLNQALHFKSLLSALNTLEMIQQIESTLGRERIEHWGQRTIDIDILLFNSEIINHPKLSIPHPQLPIRRFALIPLCAIAPKLIHPVLNESITELLDNCLDRLEVLPYKG